METTILLKFRFGAIIFNDSNQSSITTTEAPSEQDREKLYFLHFLQGGSVVSSYGVASKCYYFYCEFSTN